MKDRQKTPTNNSSKNSNLEQKQPLYNIKSLEEGYRSVIMNTFYMGYPNLQQLLLRTTTDYFLMSNNLHVYWRWNHRSTWNRAYARLKACVIEFYKGIEQLEEQYESISQTVPKNLQIQYSRTGYSKLLENIRNIYVQEMLRDRQQLGEAVCKLKLDFKSESCVPISGTSKRNRPISAQVQGRPKKLRNTNEKPSEKEEKVNQTDHE